MTGWGRPGSERALFKAQLTSSTYLAAMSSHSQNLMISTKVSLLFKLNGVEMSRLAERSLPLISDSLVVWILPYGRWSSSNHRNLLCFA